MTPFQICFFSTKVKSNVTRMRSQLKDIREVINRMLLNSHNYTSSQTVSGDKGGRRGLSAKQIGIAKSGPAWGTFW